MTALTGEAPDARTVVLHGEGAREGLTAYFVLDWSAEPHTLTAAMFPGEMPPFPEPADE